MISPCAPYHLNIHSLCAALLAKGFNDNATTKDYNYLHQPSSSFQVLFIFLFSTTYAKLSAEVVIIKLTI